MPRPGALPYPPAIRRRRTAGRLAVAVTLLAVTFVLAPTWAPHRGAAASPGGTSSRTGPTIDSPLTHRSESPAFAPSSVAKLEPLRTVDMGELLSAPAADSLRHAPVASVRPHAVAGTTWPALATPAPGVTTAGTGWAGIDSSQCGCAPPDVIVAAGPTQVVEMVNVAEEIWTKQGGFVGSTGLTQFFGSGSDYLSDPKILYDNASGRWFATVLDIPSSGNGIVRLAVSHSSAANGTWTIYTSVRTAAGTFADQPTLGISDNVVGLGGNVFSSTGSTYYGAEYWVVNKSALVAGTAASVASFGPDSAYESIHPVQSEGSTPTQYFVSSVYGLENSVAVYAVSGIPPASTSVLETNLSVRTMNAPPSGSEAGGAAVDTGDQRVQSAVWEAGSLWMTLNDACTPSGGVGTQACVRLIEVDTSSMRVVQDFDYGIAGEDLYYPAVALDGQGDLTVVYGFTSPTIDPSLAVTGRSALAPAGTLNAAVTIAAGTQTLSCGTSACRFGDYFGAARDPSSAEVYVAGEYIASSTGFWNTYVAPARTFGATSVALTGTPIAADTGQPVAFTVTVGNSPCASGPDYCTLVLPFGDGSYGGTTCLRPFSGVQLSHSFAAAGVVTVGSGGYVAVYASAGCAASSLTENLTLAPMTVTVSTAPTAFLLVVPPAGADVGQAGSLTASLGDGRPPFSLRWTGAPPGCGAAMGPQVNCTFSTPGTFAVEVEATDANAFTVAAFANLTVLTAPTVGLAVNRTNLDVGGDVLLTATPGGGTGSYTFSWNGLPAGCAAVNASSIDCTPSASGRFAPNVTVTDTFGGTATGPAVAFHVWPQPVVDLGASMSVDVGGILGLTANVTGGFGGLTYRWTGLPPGCTAADNATIVCSPGAAGTYVVHLAVTDGVGGSGAASVTLTVTPPAAGGFLADPTDLALILLALVLAGAVVAAVLLTRRRRGASPPA